MHPTSASVRLRLLHVLSLVNFQLEARNHGCFRSLGIGGWDAALQLYRRTLGESAEAIVSRIRRKCQAFLKGKRAFSKI